MKIYLQSYVNYESDNEARLLLMAKFAYGNAKNIGMSYTSFEFNYGFQPRAFYEKNVNFYFKSKFIDKISTILYKLISTYR